MLARQVWDYWLPTADLKQRNITEGLKGRVDCANGFATDAIPVPKTRKSAHDGVSYLSTDFVECQSAFNPVVLL